MVDGHASLVKEIRRRLEHAVSRGLESTAFIAMAAAESEKCATSRFLDVASQELRVVHIKKDVPNVKEGDVDGLDCSLADGGDVVWVAELGLLDATATAS